MNKKIIVINGVGGSGKDTFVEFCNEYCKVSNFSSIDKIKQIAKMMGWNGEKNPVDRKFLSDLKALSTWYNDMPYNSIKTAIEKFYNDDSQIMFIHVRESHEIKRIVDEFNAITLLIRRKNYKLDCSNSSDANVENYKYDYIIENYDLEEFKKSAKKFVENVLMK